MRGSSINFKKAQKGALQHNDRTEDEEVSYLLPQEFRLSNDYDFTAKKAEKEIIALREEASENYKKVHAQKLQAKSFLWEAVVNLDAHHTLEDLKKLVRKIEKITGFTAVQSSIHRDEGAVGKDKNGNSVPIYNYHAHIVFFTLNPKNGIQLYRKDISKPLRKQYRKQVLQYSNKNKRLRPPFHPNELMKLKKKPKWSTENSLEINKDIRQRFKLDGHIVYDRERLSFLQTIVAEELGMPRGSVSVEKEAERLGVTLELDPSVRKGHKQHRAYKRAEEKIINKIQEEHALEVQNHIDTIQELKVQMNEKDRRIQELEALLEKHTEKTSEVKQENKDLNDKLEEKNKEIRKQEEKIENLEQGVYSDRDGYREGRKTGNKLTYKRLVELRDEEISKQKQDIKDLRREVIALEKKLEPTGFEIKGESVSEKLFDNYHEVRRERDNSKQRVKDLEDKLEESRERIRSRDKLANDLREIELKEKEELTKEIKRYKELAYTGKKTIHGIDEEGKPIPAGETWKEVAENEEKRAIEFSMEIDYLSDRVSELEELISFENLAYNSEIGDVDVVEVLYKDAYEHLKERLSVVKKILDIVREHDIPSKALEGSLHEIEEEVLGKKWPPKNKSRKQTQNISSGLKM